MGTADGRFSGRGLLAGMAVGAMLGVLLGLAMAEWPRPAYWTVADEIRGLSAFAAILAVLGGFAGSLLSRDSWRLFAGAVVGASLFGLLGVVATRHILGLSYSLLGVPLGAVAVYLFCAPRKTLLRSKSLWIVLSGTGLILACALIARFPRVFPAGHESDSPPANGTLSPEDDAIVSSAEEDTIVSSATVALQPVIAALETYHRQHGRYPGAIGDLVRESLLAKSPELPPAKLAVDSGLEYHSSARPDFFVMMFRYRVEIPKESYLVIIDEFRRTYASDHPRGWETPHWGVSMGDLIADRLAPLWREKHDREILSRFMTEAVGRTDCEFLLQTKVVGWLGKGSEIKIPPEILKPDRTGICYQAEGDQDRRYCFVYKKHWFPPHFTCSSASALAKGFTVYRNMPVLDKLFLIRRYESSKESWELLRACPPCDHDHRPKSGPGRVVEDD
jgi:hypothetical protein